MGVPSKLSRHQLACAMRVALSRRKQMLSIVEAKDMTLDEWLKAIERRDVVVLLDFAFPNDKARDDYLESIAVRPVDEVKKLIRRFLLHECTGGVDDLVFDSLGHELRHSSELYNRMSRGENAWEGLTWIMDYLDFHPRKAIEAIELYFYVHCQFLDRPFWIDRLHDAIALIRGKFIQPQAPLDVLYELTPREFEYLIGNLFVAMDYDVTVTRPSADGGLDIVANRTTAEITQKSIIECKLHRSKVRVGIARILYGVVEEKSASCGILVSPVGFTRGCIAFAKKVDRLELLGYDRLNSLLNENFGPNWIRRIDWHCRGSQLMPPPRQSS